MKLEMTQTLRITEELDEAIKSVSSKIGESKQTTIRLALSLGLPLLLAQFDLEKPELRKTFIHGEADTEKQEEEKPSKEV